MVVKSKHAKNKLKLPTDRSVPVGDPFSYAYLVTGEKKIGKTSFAIEGAEELVMQCDKPQLAYEIREVMIKNWSTSRACILAMEELVEQDPDDFPYTRIVVDGAGEWYTMCQTFTCQKFSVGHPSEEGYARAWHFLRDEFTDSVNRLLRIQARTKCGLMFIAHSEWKEKNTRGGEKIERLVPNLPPKCEEILNGKCDAWFTWDYVGDKRIMVLQGDETTGAGHRIDGHFRTTDGRPIRELYMGESPKEALANFEAAFNNEVEFATYKERREAMKTGKTSTRREVRRVVRRK